MWLSHQVGRGHVCLHIGQLASQDPDAILVLPPENATGNFTKVAQRIPVRIRIDPAPFDVVASPLRVHGTANVFEAAFLVTLLDAAGLAGFLPRHAALDALAGREVLLHGERGTTPAIALGLAADGALRVRVGAREQLVHAGEVSVRAAP